MFEDFEVAFGDEDFDAAAPSAPVVSATNKEVAGEVPPVTSVPPLPPPVVRPSRVIGMDDVPENEGEDDPDLEILLGPGGSLPSQLPASVPKRKRSGRAASSSDAPVVPSKKAKRGKGKGKAHEVAEGPEESSDLSPHLEGALTTLNEHVPEAVWGEISETPTKVALRSLISSLSTVNLHMGFFFLLLIC